MVSSQFVLLFCVFLLSISWAHGIAPIKIPLLNNDGLWLASISVSDSDKGSVSSISLVLDTKLGSILLFSSQFCRAAVSQGFAPPDGGCAPVASTDSEMAAFEVVADSTTVQIQCASAQAWIAFTSATDLHQSLPCATGKSETVGFPNDSSVRYWNSTAGSLGLAPVAASSHVFSEFINQYLFDTPIVSLDLNIGADSWMTLGVAPPPAFIWSQFVAAPAYTTPQLQAAHENFDPMQLGIFSLSVCGVSLFDNATGYMAATVDTGSSCLGLPPSLFAALLSWTSFWSKKGSVLFVRDDVPLQRLPILSFSINNPVNGSSQTFQIPLGSLVLSNRRLCIEPLFSSTSIKWPPIIFGSLVIANFHFSFDYQLRISGLASKTSEQVPLNTFCQPAAVCWGQESFDESRNTCVSPYCSARFFYRLDPLKRQCVMSVPLLSLVASFLGLIAASELLLDRWRRALSDRICCHGNLHVGGLAAE